MVNHSVSRCLDLFNIKNDLTTRWNGLKQWKT
jgi:3-polyprenyl-4-hydroxybenzoate decarboxylase